MGKCTSWLPRLSFLRVLKIFLLREREKYSNNNDNNSVLPGVIWDLTLVDINIKLTNYNETEINDSTVMFVNLDRPLICLFHLSYVLLCRKLTCLKLVLRNGR